MIFDDSDEPLFPVAVIDACEALLALNVAQEAAARDMARAVELCGEGVRRVLCAHREVHATTEDKAWAGMVKAMRRALAVETYSHTRREAEARAALCKGVQHMRALWHLVPSLDHVPDDVLFHILSFLPRRDLVRLRRVNKRWAAMVVDGSLWRSVNTGDMVTRAQEHHALAWVADHVPAVRHVVARVPRENGASVRKLAMNGALETLQLWDLKNMGGHTLYHLQQCTQLRAVTLSQMQGLRFPHLRHLLSVPHIETLSLHGWALMDFANVSGDQHVPACLSLHTLSLENAVLGDLSMVMLASACPNLRDVNLCRVTTSSTQCFSTLLTMPHLAVLTMSRCNVPRDGELRVHEPLALRTLHMDMCEVAHALGLVPAGFFPHLETLQVKNAPLPDAGQWVSAMRSLRHLDLAYCVDSYRRLRIFSRTLETLEFAQAHMNDHMLSLTLDCPSLTSMDVAARVCDLAMDVPTWTGELSLRNMYELEELRVCAPRASKVILPINMDQLQCLHIINHHTDELLLRYRNVRRVSLEMDALHTLRVNGGKSVDVGLLLLNLPRSCPRLHTLELLYTSDATDRQLTKFLEAVGARLRCVALRGNDTLTPAFLDAVAAHAVHMQCLDVRDTALEVVNVLPLREAMPHMDIKVDDTLLFAGDDEDILTNLFG